MRVATLKGGKNIMAIYHFSAQVISRSKGQSAVASASYRSGERLQDERTGETKYYVRKVQPETMILAPSHAPEWVQDRNRLWNEVEKSETRKNSQLAREINIALPRELSNEQQKELIKNYIQTEFVNKGMIADIAIHRDDKENPHAHVMLTTREISEDGFTVKNRDWNQKELLEQWREQWANYANIALRKEGIRDRITHLSHDARGLEQLPTVHLGHVAHDMEQKGIQTDRGNINRERQEYNRLVVDLQQYRKEKVLLQKKILQENAQKEFLTPAEKVDVRNAVSVIKGNVSLEKISERREQIANWEQRLEKQNSYFDWKAEKFEKALGHINEQDFAESQMKQYQNELKNINWLNPFKLKENNETKEQCHAAINQWQKKYDFHEEKLSYYRDKLGFSTKEEYYTKARGFKEEREDKSATIYKQRQEIKNQRDILVKAENAIKQGEIREITSHYPELKNAGQFMKYEHALQLKEINEKAGKIVPLEQIKKEINQRHIEIEQGTKSLQNFEKEKNKSATAHKYFNQLHSIEQRIEKIENNPFLKGKMLFSKESKKEFEQLVTTRDQYKSALKNLGFEDKDSFKKHLERIQKAEKLKPIVEKQISNQQEGNAKGQNGIGLGLLKGAMQGIEQARQREVRENRKQAEKRRYRGQKENGLER